ncbi:MAG: hypothetical protein D6720_09980 [Gammaproteobacteria bacterium]|nr:MAG: hypothetical protein D6720_09980 [Gammaproteobacteria bacterium]
MPHFPSNPLENLAIDPGELDRIIDLDDEDTEQALRRVDEILQGATPGERLLLRFPPPAGDGRETLFQPLGRHLLQARREGRLARCLPAADGAGYIAVINEDR